MRFLVILKENFMYFHLLFTEMENNRPFSVF